MSSKDKDFRLITLVVEVCPLPLRELFLKYAKSDPGPSVPYTSLDNYMLLRKHDVEKLMKLPPKTIRKDQFDLIYPKANEAEWDVSLLSALLLGLFGTEVQGTEESVIRIIREIRNKLQHNPGSLTTTDAVFDTTWNDIETATTTIAKIAGGPTYETEIRNRIDETKVNNLPKLGDTLKSWFEIIFPTIHSISETTQSSHRILEATIEKRKTKAGHTSKRMKTVDTILKKLREQFAQTFYRELPDDYDQPKEASTIRQNLSHDHHITICGYEKSKYMACALSIIADLNYDMSRCVEMRKPEDWRHVDAEEVDLILYTDPFSLSVTEKEKRDLFDVFQALMDVSAISDDKERIDVVIVTEKSKLEQNDDFKCHAIFENMVVLYEPTNEKEPVDLAKRQVLYKRTQSDTVLGNMIAYSDTFIQQRRSESIDPGLLESAKEKFKRYKGVVITGPTGCGKTAFAVSLVSSIYERNQCVVLVDASEWMQVKLGEISVIIIDEFAGRFKYNAGLAESWLNRFDLIYAAVSDGKLNVIITCETARFTKVLKNFTGHPLLSHRIKLPKRGVGIVVKEEPISDNELDVNEQEQEEAREIRTNTVHAPERLLECQTFTTIKNKTGNDSARVIVDFCEMHGGTIVVIDGMFVSTINTETCDIRGTLRLPSKPHCISSFGNQQVVIVLEEQTKLQFAIIYESNIQLGETEDLPFNRDVIIRLTSNGEKHVICTHLAVYIFDLVWTEIGRISDIFGSRIQRNSTINIRDIIMKEEMIYISSYAKMVVADMKGQVLRTFSPGGKNASFYNNSLLLITTGRTLSLVTSQGEFKGVVLQGITLHKQYYSRVSNKLFIVETFQADCLKIFTIG